LNRTRPHALNQAGPRAAASPDADARLRPRGSNHVGMGQFNERVVLQAVRLHGSLAKAEIARVTHLTAQTVQTIIVRLEANGLVRKLSPVRGKVGQPSVPMALDPDGAFSIGIKIGRRSMDVLLVDFCGLVRERTTLAYAFPDPETLFDDIAIRLKAMRNSLPARQRDRLQGVGIAAPLSLGGWQTLLGIAPSTANQWAHIDIRERVAELTELPVVIVKDTAAACVAELVAGRGRNIGNFLYVFVDTFIGGGLVLDSQLREGLHGNAGAVGSMPLGLGRADATLPPAQLLSVASLFNLQTRYEQGGLDPAAASDARAMLEPWWPHTQAWLRDAAPAVALALNHAACLLDVEGVIVDGSVSPELLAALLAEVETALDFYSWEGVARPMVWTGTVGSDARAIGGALLPLVANFAPDRDVFLKLAR
jgi:predicted NBD/HSP70 family sugar kinase